MIFSSLALLPTVWALRSGGINPQKLNSSNKVK